jgi:hypothetical protein
MAGYRNVVVPDGWSGAIWYQEPDVSYFNNDDGVTVLVAFIDKQRLNDFREDREAALLSTVTNVPDGPDMTHAQRVSDGIGTTDYPSVTRRHIVAPGVALGIGSRTRSPLSTLAPATLVRASLGRRRAAAEPRTARASQPRAHAASVCYPQSL